MEKARGEAPVILMADDDEEDCLLVRDALLEQSSPVDFRTVQDGRELMDYLHQRGPQFSGSTPAPRPDIVLLDLNMPIKDGRKALREIKSDPELRGIPIFILTTSSDPGDMRECETLGADAYIIKPTRYEDLLAAVRSVLKYLTGNLHGANTD